jgi:peptidoglycan hydrolase CwlO-like protein
MADDQEITQLRQEVSDLKGKITELEKNIELQ